VDEQLQGRASTTTAVPGMLEVRWSLYEYASVYVFMCLCEFVYIYSRVHLHAGGGGQSPKMAVKFFFTAKFWHPLFIGVPPSPALCTPSHTHEPLMSPCFVPWVALVHGTGLR
jgi:hypothetical protein